MQAYGKAQLQNKIFIGANFCVPPLFCRKNGWLCVRSNERHADGDVMRNCEAKTLKVLRFDKWAQCSRMRPFGRKYGAAFSFSQAVARFFVCAKRAKRSHVRSALHKGAVRTW